MTGHPWIVAMLGGHHPGWWSRFIMHDHYNRLFSGVHSIDDGAFEYFVRWIGYGLFPWIGLLPAALVRAFGRLRTRGQGYSPQHKFELMLVLWALFGFFLFTKSSTKFHHYILPVIPPLAILIAVFLEDVLARRGRHACSCLASAPGIVLWVGQDLYRMPAHRTAMPARTWSTSSPTSTTASGPASPTLRASSASPATSWRRPRPTTPSCCTISKSCCGSRCWASPASSSWPSTEAACGPWAWAC
jgi:4-amino-4-deoxy-L-arabinose transferase-like glycosyltransferase